MILAFVAASSYAQNATPAPGEYLVDGGWGTLVVTPEPKGMQRGQSALFKINALGANGHSCEIDGSIHHGIASVDTFVNGKVCRVGFTVTVAGIDVKPLTEEECRYFCGARASFNGLYAKAIPGCENEARNKTRKHFKQLYDARQYQDARAVLEPLLTQCGKSLHWIEDGAIRNDLAITQYHLRDYSGCQDTLKQFQGDDADKYLDGLKASEPSSGDAYEAILGPARHNLMLCEKAARQQ